MQTKEQMSGCQNMLCDNDGQAGGPMYLVTFRGHRAVPGEVGANSKGRVVQLLLCVGCRDAVQDDLHRDHEEH